MTKNKFEAKSNINESEIKLEPVNQLIRKYQKFDTQNFNSSE